MGSTRETICTILETNNINNKYYLTYTPLNDLWELLEPEKLTSTRDALRVHLDQLVAEGRMEKLLVASKGSSGRKMAHYRLIELRSEEEVQPEPSAHSLKQLFADFRARMLEHNCVFCSIREDGSVEYEQRVVETRKLSL